MLSCLIQEIVIAERSESDHFSQLLEVCESGKKAKKATKTLNLNNSEWTPPQECKGKIDEAIFEHLALDVLRQSI